MKAMLWSDCPLSSIPSLSGQSYVDDLVCTG